MGIQIMITRAVTTFQSLDESISSQRNFWIATEPIVEEETLYFLSERPEFWSSWALGYRKVKVVWQGVDVDELEAIEALAGWEILRH